MSEPRREFDLVEACEAIYSLCTPATWSIIYVVFVGSLLYNYGKDLGNFAFVLAKVLAQISPF